MKLFILFLILTFCNFSYSGTQSILNGHIIENTQTEKNYAGKSSHFEKNINGWTKYDDAAAAPVDCSGGVFDSTFAQTNSTVLSGEGAALWTKTGSTSRQGEGLSLPFVIDNKHKGQTLKVNFDYLPSSVYVDDDLGVWIYDVTNATIIEPTNNRIKLSLVSTQTPAMEWQAAINSTSYRLCLHTISTSTANWTFHFDDVKIGKQQNNSGAIVTAFNSVTMGSDGFTGDTTVTTATMARVGDTAHFKVKMLFTTIFTGGTATLNLPAGMSVDLTKYPFAAGEVMPMSKVAFKDVGTASYEGQLQLNSATQIQMFVGNTSGTYAGYSTVTTTQPFTWANNDFIEIEFAVPIQGWGSTAVASSETSGSPFLFYAPAQLATGTITTTASTAVLATVGFDSEGGYNTSTGVYTIKQARYYDLHGKCNISAASGAATSYVAASFLINGSSRFENFTIGNGSAVNYTVSTSGSVNLKAGDTVSLACRSSLTTPVYSSGLSGNFFAISSGSGGQQIFLRENITAIASSNSGQTLEAAGAGEIVIYEDESRDTHGSYDPTTGVFTAQVSGDFQVNYGVSISDAAWTVGDAFLTEVRVNGTAVQRSKWEAEASVTKEISLTGSAIVYLTSGQTIDIFTDHNRTGGNNTLRASGAENYLSITRVGQ